ncbi:MAG: hypothetical protein D6736_11315 [Nitrospinota bacterium]|nr:MAG: hypothetical protein D6736_11315 [Nitrospinota bacterium]
MRKHLLFAIFGFLVMLGTFLLFWQETHQEWKQIQRAFSALRLQQATDSPGKERSVQAQYPFSQEKIAIRQLYIEPLRRTDRCTTCHLGIDDPRWQGAPQPFTTHPPPLLRFHPPQKYGCTICHRGQGLAITTAAAHGQTKHWNEPLLPKQYLEASCGLCHSGPDFRAAPVLSEGRRLVRWLGCPGCHEIRGYPP